MLKIKNLRKTFTVEKGQVRAVEGVDLELREGEFFVLLGPSGSGKSTVLRCVAGLERPEAGEIIIDNKVVFSSEKKVWVAPNERPMGMVFQSYAIWPHMTVYQNVAYPLEAGRNQIPRHQIKAAVERALAQVKMDGLAHRPAPLLSGGQQQRVALARALVINPKLFLFDEPLSNLDAKLREEMRIELKELTHSFGITSLYVTHDQLEALAMADRIGVIMEGRILELGPPQEIYLRPRTRQIAEFMGTTNKLQGVVVKCNHPMGIVKSEVGMLEVMLSPGVEDGSKVEVVVRPEHVVVHHERSSETNVLEGVVEKSIFLGSNLVMHLKISGKHIQAIMAGEEFMHEGKDVWVHLPPKRCIAVM